MKAGRPNQFHKLVPHTCINMPCYKLVITGSLRMKAGKPNQLHKLVPHTCIHKPCYKLVITGSLRIKAGKPNQFHKLVPHTCINMADYKQHCVIITHLDRGPSHKPMLEVNTTTSLRSSIVVGEAHPE
jgi:hypothetical protein